MGFLTEIVRVVSALDALCQALDKVQLNPELTELKLKVEAALAVLKGVGL